MLGFGVKSGPEAISFGNTLFRIEEISWIKAAGLSLGEKIAKVGLLLLAVAFVVVMADAKGSYLNLECLLALFPLHLGITMGGDLRLASTGDFEESYEDRVGRNRKLFTEWIEALAKQREGWLRLNDGDYEYLINPARIAWASAKPIMPMYPLFIAVVFGAYAWVAQQTWDFADASAFLSDLTVLQFPQGTGTLVMVCGLIVLVSLVAFAVSVKRAVVLCAPGGVQDSLWVTSDDLGRVLETVAGRVVAPQSPQVTAAKPAAAPRSEPPPPKIPKPAPEPRIEPSEPPPYPDEE